MSNEHAPADAQTIRETYNGVLWAPYLPEATELDMLGRRLTGHVQFLVPEVTRLAARMRGITRFTAVHVLRHAHQTLTEEAGDLPPVTAVHVQDLAVIARALLTLYEHPGPLGPPTGEEGIEETVHRRMCGACSKPIQDGEPFEQALFASNSSGSVHGYLHTDGCAALAEERSA